MELARRTAKKAGVSLLACILALSCLMLAPAYAGDIEAQQLGSAPWNGTSATQPALAEGVYQISTGAELKWFANTVNAGTPSINAVLVDDIDLGGYQWTPIGTNAAAGTYTGSFDGAGHTVDNLRITIQSSTTMFIQGLFGRVNGATIKNLSVAGQVTAGSTASVASAYVGGVVAWAENGTTINNVHADVDVSINRTAGTYQYVGGVVAYLLSSEVLDCSNTGNVSGYMSVGGVVGSMLKNSSSELNSSISRSYNSGAVSGYQSIGGITGASAVNTLGVFDCYNSGSITGETIVGGISGGNSAGTTIENCYNTGAVTGTTNTTVGGVVGSLSQNFAISVASVVNSYNTGSVSPSTGGGAVGRVMHSSATTSQVYYLEGSADTGIVSLLNGATEGTVSAALATSDELKALVASLGAGFNSDTDNINNGYPVLAWQGGGSSITEPGTEPGTQTGYTVSLTEDQAVAVGDEASFAISVSSKEKTSFSSLDLVITYDNNVFEYVSVSDIANYMVDSSTAGTLRISSFGEEKPLGDAFALTLRARALTEGSTVSIASAKVDEGSNANAQDAPEAVTEPAYATVVVSGYHVTLSEHLLGAGSAQPNAAYSFSAADYANYDYVLGVTVGGTDATAALVSNGDGSYVIPAASIVGPIVVTASRTAKSYSVTFAGSGAVDATGTSSAVYGTAYSFLLNKETGYTYEILMTIDGEAYTGYGTEDDTCTIPGVDLTGAVSITVEKTSLAPQQVAISFDGMGAGDAQGQASAAKGQPYTFVLNKVSGYAYEVSASSEAGAVAVVDNGDGTYTIAGENMAADTTIVVSKELTLELTVQEYVKLDGQSIFLVIARGMLEEGEVYTYGGNTMFWSAALDAFAYLTIEATSFNAQEAESLVAAATGEAIAIVYDGDVNETSLVDINDAQLVWNMYNATYADFDTVSMVRFLKADMNGDFKLNVLDAAVIVAAL